MHDIAFVPVMRKRGEVRMMWGVIPTNDQCALGILPMIRVFVLSADGRLVDVKDRAVDQLCPALQVLDRGLINQIDNLHLSHCGTAPQSIDYVKHACSSSYRVFHSREAASKASHAIKSSHSAKDSSFASSARFLNAG